MFGELQSPNATSARVSHVPLSEGHAPGRVIIADAELLLGGHFKKVGPDLIITGKDGQKVVVSGYFNNEKLPDLVTAEGAGLPGHLVERLAVPQTAGQYAQVGAPAGGVVIGKVERLGGNATVQHANGVVEELKIGDNVLQGDVVETRDGSLLAISFSDGTAFNMGANARMVLNELVYEAGGSSNSAVFSLVKGTITFVAGQVAKTGNMRVDTPVASMGIRGTTVNTSIQTDIGGNIISVNFSLMADPDGKVGLFNIIDRATGVIIGTVSTTSTSFTVTPSANLGVLAQQINKTPEQVAMELAIAQNLFPVFLANPANFQSQNPQDVQPKAPGSNNGSSSPPGGSTQPLPDPINFGPGNTGGDGQNGNNQNNNNDTGDNSDGGTIITFPQNAGPSIFVDAPPDLIEAVSPGDMDANGDAGTATSVAHITKIDLDGQVFYNVAALLAAGWELDSSGAYRKDGVYGSAFLDTNANTLRYELDPAKSDPLNDSEHPTETFTIPVIDNEGATATTTATFTVNGQDDPPELVAGRSFLTFDGNDAAVGAVATSNVGNIADGGVTLEGWVNWDGTNSGHPQLLFYNGSTSDSGFGLRGTVVSQGQLALDIFCGGVGVINLNVSIGTGWHHLAVTRSNEQFTVYVDDSTYQISGSPQSIPGPFQYPTYSLIGGNWDGIEGFSGSIAEVRFWDVARTAQEIEEARGVSLNGDEDGLVGYWPLDEGNGTNVADHAGADQDLTLVGNPIWVFDNNVEYAECPVVLNPYILLSDQDSQTLEGATVKISDFVQGDLLNFDCQDGPISGIYNECTGVLTLYGDASVAEYEAALRSITFSSTNENVKRTIDWQVDDGTNLSVVQQTTVNNEPPVIDMSDAVAADENSETFTTRFHGAQISDVDAGNNDALTVTFVSAAGGTLAFASCQVNLSDLAPDANILSFTGSIQDINTALDAGITYTRPDVEPATDTVTVTVKDAHGATDIYDLLFAVADPPPNAPPNEGIELLGASKKDMIFGTERNDTLNGNGGNDILIGNAGDDTLTGGTGADQFVFGFNSGQDTIVDFIHGEDKIVLDQIYESYTDQCFLQLLSDLDNACPGVHTIALPEGNTITLSNVDVNTLDANDFVVRWVVLN